MSAMLLGLSLIFALLPLYVVSTTPAAYLMFTTSNGVYRIDLGGSNLEELVTTAPGARDVDYHYQEDKLFWGHVTAASAGKADLDGTGETTVPPLRSELAVDWKQNKIYHSTPNTLNVYDIASDTDDSVPVPSGTYYDLSMYPAQNKLYSVDGSSSQLHEYNVNTWSPQTFPLECPARYLSHIEDGQLFYSCPSGGVYQFNLNTLDSALIYDDTDSDPFGDVTSYMNDDDKVFWAREGRIYSMPVGGSTATEIYSNSETVQGLTVVHSSLQP